MDRSLSYMETSKNSKFCEEVWQLNEEVSVKFWADVKPHHNLKVTVKPAEKFWRRLTDNRQVLCCNLTCIVTCLARSVTWKSKVSDIFFVKEWTLSSVGILTLVLIEDFIEWLSKQWLKTNSENQFSRFSFLTIETIVFLC